MIACRSLHHGRSPATGASRALPLALALFFASALPARGDDALQPLLNRIASAQASAVDTLTQQYRLEQDLLTPESDRIQVFFSLRNAEKLMLSDVELFVDGARVANHGYTPAERGRLKNRAVQMLYAGRLPQGNHTLRVVAKLESGERIATDTLRFVKANTSRFIEFQLEGEPSRVLTVLQW